MIPLLVYKVICSRIRVNPLYLQYHELVKLPDRSERMLRLILIVIANI